jgi:hypothetical protein
MADIKTSIVVDLAGNLIRKSKQYSNSIGNFSKKGQRHLAGINRVAKLTGNNLLKLGNRYTALATGAGAVGAGNMVVKLERRMTRLGIQANVSSEKINKLKNEIFDIAQAPEIRVDPGQITSAIEAIVEKTGDLEFAEKNIRNIGLAINATGADGGAIGEILAEFQKMGIKAPQEVLKALDVLNVQGKEGAFTLQNLAALGPRAITAYTSLGRTGVPALREMGAALQVIRQGTGSSEQATTAFEALLRTMTDPVKLKKLQAGGIQVFDAEELKKGREQLRPINELMIELIQKSKGRKTVLGQIFDAEAVRAFNSALAEFNRTGRVDSLDKFMNVQADGTTTINDSARAAKDASGALSYLFTALKQYADSELTEPIQSIADSLNSLEPEKLQRVFKVIAGGAAGLIALSLAASGIRSIKTIAGVFRGGKAGGVGSSIPGLAGGVQPVYVVNFPGAGLPGVGGSINKGTVPGKRNFRSIARAAFNQRNMKGVAALGAGALTTAALAVAASAATGIGIGTVIDKKLQKSEGGREFRHNLGGTIATILARLGSKDAQAALDREFNRDTDLGGTLKIKIDSEGRTKVTQLEKNGGLDFDVDAGMAMSAL